MRDRVSSHLGVVLPKRHALGSGTSLTGGKRDYKKKTRNERP